MHFLFRLLYSSIAVLAIAYILPGVEVASITVALIVAAVLAFLNAYLKPLLILLTIPLTLFTLGLFLLVINAAIILFTDFLIDGFEVKSFWWALFFSLLLSLAVSFYEGIEKDNRRRS
jgi:putative membrane protein